MTQEEQVTSAPAFSVKVNGRDLPLEAKAEVTRVVVEDSLDSAATFAIEMNNLDAENQQVKWSDAGLFDPGGVVEVQMGYAEAMETVMVGEITGLEVSFPERARALLTVRGLDRLKLLKQPVVFGVGDLRRVEHVVAVGVVVQLRAQVRGALRRRGLGGKQVRCHQENRRRACGEPSERSWLSSAS